MGSPYFSGPKPLAAQERLVTPKGNSPKSPAPAKLNTKPAPINTKPAKFTGPQYQGKPVGLGEVGHLASNVIHGLTKPSKPYTFTEHGITAHVTGGKSLSQQAAGITGLPTEAITHPIRFVQHQQKLTPQQKADSAINLHLLGGLMAAPGSEKIAAAAEKRGQAVAFSGGGKKAEEAPIIRAAKSLSVKLKPDEAKALQVVHEGVPIGKRIADQKALVKAATSKSEAKAAQKELSSLQAASKHVHDVNGMPRLLPGRHKLIETYAKAEKSLEKGKLAQQVREGLSGKAATKGMTPYEKIGAKLDNPDLEASAAQLRAKQDAMVSQQRGQRAAAGSEAMQNAEGVGAFHAAKAQLKGEFDKPVFSGFKQFDENTLNEMMNHISNHPDLQFYEKLNTMRAIERASQGKVPTHAEMGYLRKAFGDVTAKQMAAAPWTAHAKTLIGEAINVPRALMSTLDFSGLLRQNLVATITHPNITRKNIIPMLKAFKSEEGYRAIEDAITSDPLHHEMIKAGLPITDFEGGLANREEAQFGVNLAEKLTGGKRSPVRMSGRAYVALLNKTRVDLYKSLRQDLVDSGRPVTDSALRDIAKAIGSATGRGSGPEFMRESLPALNSLFFSPRLLFSRLDYLNPVNYTKLDPVARKEYLRGALGLVGTVGTVLAIAKLAGAQVNTDPRNADFAKIRFGDTRIDPLGGFQQPIRLLAQLSPSFMGGGKIISSTTGKTLTLGPEGPGKLSRFDIGLRFAQGKLAPVPGIIVDLAKQNNFQGQPFSWKQEAYQHLSPLAIQDAIQLGQQSGPAAGAAGYGLSALGVGVQTYGPKKTKTRGAPQTYFSNSPSGGSDYFGSSSSGGSSYFGR